MRFLIYHSLLSASLAFLRPRAFNLPCTTGLQRSLVKESIRLLPQRIGYTWVRCLPLVLVSNVLFTLRTPVCSYAYIETCEYSNSCLSRSSSGRCQKVISRRSEVVLSPDISVLLEHLFHSNQELRVGGLVSLKCHKIYGVLCAANYCT
jgi:hypothetical protein